MSQRRTEPVYRLQIPLIIKFLVAAFLNRPRDLAKDVGAAVAAVKPRPRIQDVENIPLEGPFVLIANHFERPGLKVYYGGTLISYAVAQRRTDGKSLHWLMTSEWYNYRFGPVPIPVWLLRWLFRRIARVYGLVIVPRATERVMGRAAAMRTILETVRKGEPIGLFPEGVGGGELVQAMPGVGVFLASLSERGVPIVPAGLFEENGVLTVRFGPPFSLQLPSAGSRVERDRHARQQLMVAIGRLLPQEMWGYYKDAMTEAGGANGSGEAGRASSA